VLFHLVYLVCSETFLFVVFAEGRVEFSLCGSFYQSGWNLIPLLS